MIRRLQEITTLCCYPTRTRPPPPTQKPFTPIPRSTFPEIAAPAATDEQYSPPHLVSALREVSARSQPLGVEGIFSAMARDDVFMNEVLL